MLFDIISTQAPALERRRTVPDSIADARYPFAALVTRHEWQLLLEMWERLQPHADRFASAFFDTLFAQSPEFVRFFRGASLDAQFLQFAQLITELVSAHRDPVELQRRIDRVVGRFTAAGSTAAEDDAIRAAIAAMLGEVSAAAMSFEMRSSWKSAYISVVATMRDASRRPHRRPIAQAA